MRPGGLFFAIATAQRDGHDYVADAFGHGARAAIVGRIPAALQQGVATGEVAVVDGRSGSAGRAGDQLTGRPVLVLVEDPLQAVQRCAAWWRRRHRAKVVAIAGAVGKTTTKELLANILEGRYRTLRTAGNFNNEYGLPITLLQLAPAHDVVALEIGISDVGEMATFAAMADADVAVMTCIVPEHMHQLHDLDTVEREEGRLIEALPREGLAVLNADDRRVARMAGRTTARVVYFGTASPATVQAAAVTTHGLTGISFQLRIGGQVAVPGRIHLPLVGGHFVTAALAAACAALELGCSVEEVAAGLARPPQTRRLVPLHLAGDVTVLDDSYNASPDSTRAALDVLAECRAAGRRIAVLGDMLELGDFAPVAHQAVGDYVPGRADVLITAGDLGRGIARAARGAGLRPADVHECADAVAATEVLGRLLRSGDTVLVKGSHDVHLERVVAALRRERGVEAPPASESPARGR